jgi:hypothetical protein
MRRLAAVLLLALAAPAAAQVYLGAEVGPDAFVKGDDAKPDTSGEDAFAWALSAEISTSTLYTVLGSTEPERELFKYLRQGVYRQELAALLLLSERTAVPVAKLAAELPKAGGLAGLAKKHKADAIALFEEAGRLKAAADVRLPLFLSVSTTVFSAASSTAAPAAVEAGSAPVHDDKK